MPPGLSVVVHDVAPATWDLCRRLMDAVHEVAPVQMTLLAVPRYHRQPHDERFDAWLAERLQGGDELALHGYTHWDDGQPQGWLDHLRRRVYTAGEGEFCALSCAQAMLRLTAGMRWFEQNRWPLHGFVAPAWLMSPGTWSALRALPLRYTCTLRQLVPLPESEPLTSQSLVYSTRSAWRRAMSRAWNPAVAATQRHRPLLRFELHPHDVAHPAVRRSWQRLLARHLLRRQPLTLAQAARSWQEAQHPGASRF